MWGTLLGCVREGSLLRHDTDIDIGILGHEYGIKDKLIAAMRKRGYDLTFDRPFKLRFTHPRSITWVDIDFVFPWNGRMITFFEGKKEVEATHFPLNAFDNFREIVFLSDLAVLIPDPPEPVLTTIYGDWRTPIRKYKSGSDLLNRLHLAPGEPRPRVFDPHL
jgi:hypothetical protein